MKTVFITGATKNTGLAIAKYFAIKGYQVAISSRSIENAEETAAELSKTYGIKTKGYALSLVDIKEIKDAFEDIRKTFGGLDVFVGNSANLGVGQDILAVTEEGFDAVMDVNIKGNFFCCQQAALLMKEKRNGSIVLIGSVHYKGAVRGRGLYATSKGAMATMVRSLAYELAEYGIRINQVVAGAIRTNRWDYLTEEEMAARRANWPLGIESTGEDIAKGVYYLASDDSGTVTGTDLTIDSGVLTCLLKYDGGSQAGDIYDFAKRNEK